MIHFITIHRSKNSDTGTTEIVLSENRTSTSSKNDKVEKALHVRVWKIDRLHILSKQKSA